MAPTEQRSRLPLPEIGAKWPPWEPLTGSFIKVPPFLCLSATLCADPGPSPDTAA
jgi:hypothetical protein